MAEVKTIEKIREYVIPLRKEWRKAKRYKRTSRSVKAIKQFIAKHMRVPERDTSKVKLDIYLNNELWHKGPRKAKTRIRVKAIQKGDIIEVSLIEERDKIGFHKKRQDKLHYKVEKKKLIDKVKAKPEDKKKDDVSKSKPVAPIKSEEVRSEKESEKEKDTDSKDEKKKDTKAKIQEAKVPTSSKQEKKHLSKISTPTVQRKALKK